MRGARIGASVFAGNVVEPVELSGKQVACLRGAQGVWSDGAGPSLDPLHCFKAYFQLSPNGS